jgi:hypothetical protein
MSDCTGAAANPSRAFAGEIRTERRGQWQEKVADPPAKLSSEQNTKTLDMAKKKRNTAPA